ncbi:MAG: hypothetical protein A3C30_02605 [Candidatus Levybacteria bacterium RIFCSPHIGHO2_02_FULL_40_18]|nr:MAG: hypothetical protein A2869_05370 [Candidatus Levybacteria bacterium RIFCSPHIGHO2_01_FULL_40_58]OGH26866.1 MAG: hypothetical protein A3C30_02605 [Candidatus Levybacteria bacterium RIFCSPHIGHO2_02_FULL_40_18]OGH31988.1 MAG: hypothetical protein A3E43_03585 [Candidatus Levybacteria bacterium RIFCSPHIGHO2_12_FULL_40_31]OGH40890.1 MAG: hypothetical protein A2894_04815 [Candidatus Levybacteria bacterium RIFCSPLOWO2_01_FULL_40_64]OGH49539.1 MAG: hypothetical protein A3I54_00130 [Candidatus Lev
MLTAIWDRTLSTDTDIYSESLYSKKEVVLSLSRIIDLTLLISVIIAVFLGPNPLGLGFGILAGLALVVKILRDRFRRTQSLPRKKGK